MSRKTCKSCQLSRRDRTAGNFHSNRRIRPVMIETSLESRSLCETNLYTHSANIGVGAANVFGFNPSLPVAASCENTVTFP